MTLYATSLYLTPAACHTFTMSIRRRNIADIFSLASARDAVTLLPLRSGLPLADAGQSVWENGVSGMVGSAGFGGKSALLRPNRRDDHLEKFFRSFC
jgi:hypothetical protein